MTILLTAALLVATLALAFVASWGLPETMRHAALWLLIHARRIEERREERAQEIRWALELEAR